MNGVWLYCYLAIAGAAIVLAALMSLQTWEHRRFGRSRMRELHSRRARGRVLLLAPCKGLDLGLEDNLRALFQQHYDDYQIVFIVQEQDDPAVPVIRQLMQEFPKRPSHLVVAGPATSCGQKVHNLLAATANLPEGIDYLVFVDSDASPRPEWLNALVLRLDQPGVGATTGYRWFVPLRPTWANLLLYSLNSAIALLMGPSRRHLAWGGSWAIRRELFDNLAVRRFWDGTLSDDLVLSRVLWARGLAITFQPPSMVASPLDYSLRNMLGFLRRQYLIVRFHAPMLWLMALAASTLGLVSYTGGLLLLAAAFATGVVSPWLPGSLLLAQYGLGVFRAWVRQDAARTYFPGLYARLSIARRFDILAGPIVLVANWLGLAGSCFGRTVVWRGIAYRLCLGGQVETIAHLDRPARLASDALDPTERHHWRKAG